MAFLLSGGSAAGRCVRGRAVASRKERVEASASKRTVVRMNAEKEEKAQETKEAQETKGAKNDADDDDDEFELPPEPYPGYYKDLERSGLDPKKEMKKKALQAKQKRKKVGGKASLYKPDGTPYAPWMIGAVQEEAGAAAGRKPKTDAIGSLANDPQAQEVAGVGLRYKLLGDDLLLNWSTGDEAGNQGFLIRKRKGKTDEWVKVADYKSHPAELTSKGSLGASYTFMDKNAEPGTWVYRVTDVDKNGNMSDLSQTVVEMQSAGEQRTQVVALVAVVGILLVLGFLGTSLDPISGL